VARSRLLRRALIPFAAVMLVAIAAGVVTAGANSTAGPARWSSPKTSLAGFRASLATEPCFPRLTIVSTRSDVPLCSHGPDLLGGKGQHNRVFAYAPTTTTMAGATTTTTTALPANTALCYGTGDDGDRVQLVYAHGPDVADALASSAATLRQVAGQIDGIMSGSAAEVGAERHYRFVTDRSCSPTIIDIAMSADARDDFGTMIDELMQGGLNRADRKYLVFGDAQVYCGVAAVAPDDRPSQYNQNDALGFSRLDRNCWDAATAGHELMHALGSVQPSAPHAGGNMHCTDHEDMMCGAAGTSVCPRAEWDRYDCNKDDYFNPGPVGAGSYLASHWNTAYSLFLETRAGTTTYPGPPIAPPPSPVPPAPRRSQSYTGVATAVSGAVYSVTTGDGPMSVVVTANAPVGITVTVQEPGGRVMTSRHGTGSVTASGIVLSGTQKFTVSSDAATTFSMNIDYPGAS